MPSWRTCVHTMLSFDIWCIRYYTLLCTRTRPANLCSKHKFYTNKFWCRINFLNCVVTYVQSSVYVFHGVSPLFKPWSLKGKKIRLNSFKEAYTLMLLAQTAPRVSKHRQDATCIALFLVVTTIIGHLLEYSTFCMLSERSPSSAERFRNICAQLRRTKSLKGQ